MMRAMVDIKCDSCRRKFGFRYLGQETHPCYYCHAINDLTELRQALDKFHEDRAKAKIEHNLPDPLNRDK